MAGEGIESNLENRLSNPESHVPNINLIWDFRRLLKFSQERLQELKKTPTPDHDALQLERAIIRGASREIRRLEKEALCTDPTLR